MFPLAFLLQAGMSLGTLGKAIGAALAALAAAIGIGKIGQASRRLLLRLRQAQHQDARRGGARHQLHRRLYPHRQRPHRRCLLVRNRSLPYR